MTPFFGGNLLQLSSIRGDIQTRTFSVKDAQEICPILIRMSHRHATIVNQLAQRKNKLKSISEIELLDKKISQQVLLWEDDVSRLGAIPKGLWMVDLDAGFGYFCWKYPEPNIVHWHGYQEGFSSRKTLNLEKGLSEIENSISSGNRPS
jgi:hypothetical protein